MPVLEVLKQNTSGNSACIKLKDGAIYYSVKQKEQFLTHYKLHLNNKKKPTLGDNLGCRVLDLYV